MKVSIIKQENYEIEKLKLKIEQAINLIGGLTKYIKSGEKVLLKPNLLSERAPETAVITHPNFIVALTSLLLDHGLNIYIGDTTGFDFSPPDMKKIYDSIGLTKALEKYNVKFLFFDEGEITIKNDKGLLYKKFVITKFVNEFDKIINIPKFKTHSLTYFTGAIKNLFGFIPGLKKAEYHLKLTSAEQFTDMIFDLLDTIKPDLNIMDAILGMEGQRGPAAGNPRQIGLIMASESAIYLDYVVLRIMGYTEPEISDLPFGKSLLKRNISICDVEIVGENLNELIIYDFNRIKNNSESHYPGWFIKLVKSYVSPKPKIINKICKKCRICEEKCPAKTIEWTKRKMIIHYGKCIRCFCCMEVCPENAFDIKRNIFSKILGLG